MVLSKERIGGILLLIFCVTYGFLSQKITLLPMQERAAFHARTMPEILTVLGTGLSIVIVLFPSSSDRLKLAGYSWATAAMFLALMSLYGLTVRPFGFILSTSAFLMAGFALLGERSIGKLLIVAVPLAVGFWLLMAKGLDVFIEPLPWFLKG